MKKKQKIILYTISVIGVSLSLISGIFATVKKLKKKGK